MIEAGDVHLAELNEDRRWRVLVLSNRRFNTVTGRVLVAPEVEGEPDEVPFPWRVEASGAVFAVDLLRSLPVGRLLDRTDRVPITAMQAARRALRNIT